jgi:hypothetical protein
MFTKGTVLHSAYRGVLVFLAFAITTMLAGNPEWGTVTIGSIGAAVVHFIASQLEA